MYDVYWLLKPSREFSVSIKVLHTYFRDTSPYTKQRHARVQNVFDIYKHNKEYHVEELFNNFHLNGHTLGFYLQN